MLSNYKEHQTIGENPKKRDYTKNYSITNTQKRGKIFN